MNQFSKLFIVSSMCAITACTATSELDKPSYSSPSASTAASEMKLNDISLMQSASPEGITLNKIMSDPDWLGRQPENARWHPFRDNVMYDRKQEGKHFAMWVRCRAAKYKRCFAATSKHWLKSMNAS